MLGRFTLRSPAPPEEVLRRAARLVTPQASASIADGEGRGRRRAFRGVVEGSGFAMRRVLSSGRVSPVAVRGAVAPERGGTRIDVRLGLARGRPLASLALLVAGAALAAWLAADAARGGALSGERLGYLLAYPLAAAMAVFRVAFERARVRRLLGYLTGEITYTGLAHELAGGRE
jgi:hypothetical protein